MFRPAFDHLTTLDFGQSGQLTTFDHFSQCGQLTTMHAGATLYIHGLGMYMYRICIFKYYISMNMYFVLLKLKSGEVISLVLLLNAGHSLLALRSRTVQYFLNIFIILI